MSQPQSHSPRTPSIIHAPPCDLCGKTMRLESEQSAEHFHNLEECRFVCDCGVSKSALIRTG